MNLKNYDIVRIMRHPDDPNRNLIHNEIFNIDSETKQIRCLMNPRMHNKTVTCLLHINSEREQKVLEEVNKIRAPMYVSDHRDTIIDKKIPPGYKIIGVRGFKSTHDDMELHIADFIIWKPTPGWLDISLDGQAKRDAANLKHTQMKMDFARNSLLAQNAVPKNFIKLNNERLRY